MVRVSVILPCFNSERYLHEAIQSVLIQTYQDYELVIIDDGSIDRTKEIALSYKNPCIRYYRQENRGVSTARNLGISLAKGEYISFLDSDDYYLPDKLKKEVSLLDSDLRIGMVASGWNEVDECGRLIAEVRPWDRMPVLNLRTFLTDCPVLPSSVMIKREWLNNVNAFDIHLRRIEDWDLWLRLAKAGCQMVWQREILSNYRFHTFNVTRDTSLLKEGIFNMLDKFYQDNTLPMEIIGIKSDVYVFAHLHVACNGYMTSNFAISKDELHQAIQLSPRIIQKEFGEISIAAEWLSNSGYSSIVKDRQAYFKKMLSNLPISALSIRKEIKQSLKKLILNERLNLIYKDWNHGNYKKVIALFPLVLIDNPRLITNKGFIKIMFIVLVRFFSELMGSISNKRSRSLV